MPHAFDGLEFVEVASVTRIAGGIAMNVIPDRAECHVNFRYAPGRSPGRGRGAARRALRRPRRAADRRERALRSRGHGHRASTRWSPPATSSRAPKQAWTPVAEFGAAGLDAVNFGPGDPAQAHKRDEHVEIAALERAHAVLEAFARCG